MSTQTASISIETVARREAIAKGHLSVGRFSNMLTLNVKGVLSVTERVEFLVASEAFAQNDTLCVAFRYPLVEYYSAVRVQDLYNVANNNVIPSYMRELPQFTRIRGASLQMTDKNIRRLCASLVRLLNNKSITIPASHALPAVLKTVPQPETITPPRKHEIPASGRISEPVTVIETEVASAPMVESKTYHAKNAKGWYAVVSGDKLSVYVTQHGYTFQVVSVSIARLREIKANGQPLFKGNASVIAHKFMNQYAQNVSFLMVARSQGFDLNLAGRIQ